MAAVVTERQTGTPFPRSFPAPENGTPLALLGCGLRERRVMGLMAVRVYAVGCHVEEQEARRAFEVATKTTGTKEAALRSAMRSGSFGMCLTLCFVREITKDQFLNSISSSMEPALRSKGLDSKIVQRLLSTLASLECSKGSRIFLTFQGKDKILVSGMKGSDVPPDLKPTEEIESTIIQSVGLVSLLKQQYFGAESIVPTLRGDIANSLDSFLEK